MTKPRLVLAEDHQLVSDSLSAMLAADYDIVAAVADGGEVAAAVNRHRPDAVLLDLSMPNRSGIELLLDVHRASPDVPILVLTMHVDSELVAAAMRAGAAGYVPKNATLDELKEALRIVLAGEAYVSPKLPKHAHHGRSSAGPPGFNQLTPHQQRIVRLLATGMSSQQIADELGVTVHTVRFHRKNIKRVLGLRNELEMYRYASMAGPEDERGSRGRRQS